MSTMAIRVRPITQEEHETLERWERTDDVVRYRRARILFLSEAGWKCPAIAVALGLHVETVRDVIQAFNEGGIDAITPQPRSGGRPPRHPPEVAEAAQDLVSQRPSPEEGRASWTLDCLAKAIANRFESIEHVSREAVRRLLAARGIVYRRTKYWLISPDPRYGLHKRQRDRLLVMARTAADGAAVWLDQSWFSRWPYPFRTWARRKAHPLVARRWNEAVETTALYAALDDETQEAFVRWADGQPDSSETIRFLDALMAYWTEQGKRFIVLFWDRAPWHQSRQTRDWVRAYNERAKREGLTRLILCFLPVRSPWLMPLEPIFGWIKHQMLGDRQFETVADLRRAVERCFRQRVAEAKQRRDAVWQTAPATA